MKQIEGQIDLWEAGMTRQEEMQYCRDCAHAKYREQVNGNPIWYCNVARAFITIHSFNWLCRNKSEGFERRK